MIEAFFPIASNLETVKVSEKTQSQAKPLGTEDSRLDVIENKNDSPYQSSLGISISEFNKKRKIEYSLSSVDEQQIELSESFTPLELLNEWRKYADLLTEEHHLKNTMLHCLPDLLSKNEFEVVVNNPVQEERLKEHEINILNALRMNLKNSTICMKLRISVENEKKLGFTTLERFNLMIEQNEELGRLKDEFGLEIL